MVPMESFDINRATGQLITKAVLNFEGNPYTVMVTATDPFGAMVMSDVTITVTDVNEAPIGDRGCSIDHAESNDETHRPAAGRRRNRLHRQRR